MNETARRIGGSALTLLVISGCASRAPAPELEQTVRFALVPSPGVGGAGDPAPGDLLLEAVTLLSEYSRLDFSLVPGPLLAPGAELSAQEELAGALGSLAGPVYTALGPDDPPALLELLGAQVAGHPGEARVRGRLAGRLRPLVLGPDGQPPEGGEEQEDEPAETLLALAGVSALAPGSYPLIVFPGEEVRLLHGPGGVELSLPPLSRPPHLIGVVTLEKGVLSLELLSVTGEQEPEPPRPVPLLR